MRAVRLTRALVLESAVRSGDGAGGFSESWQALGTVWADVRPGSGRGGEVLGVAVPVQPMRIMVRGVPQGHVMRPKAGMRFRDGVRLYRVLAVTEADGTGRHLVCAAEEVTA